MDAFFSVCAAPLLSRFWAEGEDDWPPAFAAGALKTRGQFCPSNLGQYSGIQIPKNQKPQPPNTGLNTGMAL
jgi:hypothetical protein